MGLGTGWVGGIAREAITTVLQLPPQIELVGLLTLGFPAEEPAPPARKTLAEIVYHDIYGHRQAGGAKPGRVITGPLGVLLRKLRITFRG